MLPSSIINDSHFPTWYLLRSSQLSATVISDTSDRLLSKVGKTLKSIKDYYQQQISKKSSEIYARVNVALEKMEQVYREEIG